MTSHSACGKCKKPLPKRDFLVCVNCKLKYDLECAGVSYTRFNIMEPLKKTTWKCKPCYGRGKNSIFHTNTPARSDAELSVSSPCPDSASPFDEVLARTASSLSDSINVTIRSKPAKTSPATATTEDAGSYVTENLLREILKQELTAALKTHKNQVTAELKIIQEQVTGFRESLSFFNKQFDEIKADLVEKTTLINQLKNENEKLHVTVYDLSSRLNTVELHMRECNIEINGIPENRSENLINTVMQLTKSIDNPLEVADIQHVTRIAKLNRDSDKPRAVIAKLRSPLQRDCVLAAVFKYNKQNKEEKLNSHHLGIGGTRKPVFVSEHLTPANKSLHAAARRRAKDMSYKFVWTRNGRVYVRKDEYSQALLVRNLEGIGQIK